MADRNSLNLSSLCNQERERLTFKRLYSTTTKDRLNARALPKNSNQIDQTPIDVLCVCVCVFVCKRETEGGRGCVLRGSGLMEIHCLLSVEPGKVGLKASSLLDLDPHDASMLGRGSAAMKHYHLWQKRIA